MLCKDEGFSIAKCLTKMNEGHTTNGRKYLNEKHREKLKEIKASKEAEKRLVYRCVILFFSYSHYTYFATD